MSFARPRPLALLLTLVLMVTAVSPVLADDPADQAGSTTAPPMQPSVHAEMLLEHEDDPATFTPGDMPQKLGAPDVAGGGTMNLEGGTGGIAALPNGLSHEVFGYLPSWMLGASDLANLRYDLVSTIAYFGVEARSSGSLATTTTGAKGWSSSAMTSVISKAHQRGVRVVLTVTMMAWDGDYAAMRALLGSPSRRATLIGNIAAAVKARNADGVNVDFEPVPIDQKANLTTFVRELKAGLRAAGAGSYVTVATMAGAASWATGYDVVGLTASGAADALLVMAYDFHYAGSARAGGVAPYDSDHILAARVALRDYLEEVSASKIIWGVPYYGREWSTVSSGLNARTNDVLTSQAGFYTFHRREAAEHGRQWDSAGRVPWYRYRSSAHDTWVQGYYDDPTSLKHKYAMVRDNGLRGAGIWHLLMDGTRDDLWDTLYTQFGPLPFTDISGSKFALDIVWLSEEGITAGCSETAFCPKGAVTRGQMASFLSRFLELPPTTTDYFDDDDDNKHEANINRIAAAGITFGCGEDRFCPDGIVLRDQMASFLSRALELPATSVDHYDDDESNRHEDAINRFAEADVTHGCGTDRYCPKGTVVREQMAAFLHRASRR